MTDPDRSGATRHSDEAVAPSEQGVHQDPPAPVERLTTRVVYANRWMTVREDEVRFPGGHRGIYGVVEKADFALVVPWDGSGLHMVRQFRYPTGAAHWEFPQGSAEEGGRTPEALARGELKEETGLSAGHMVPLGFLYQANGYSDQGFHVFLATDLAPGERRLEATELGMQTAVFSVAEFEAMLRRGDVRDGPTVAAYGLLRLHGTLEGA
ncbi:MAG TPA: NUDIX hydrolase [Trueperaceae bacterium]